MLYLICAALLTIGLRYGYWVVIQRRCVEIDNGLVWQTGVMQPLKLHRFVERHKIHTVVDFRRLDEPADQSEAELLSRLNVEYIRIPCDRSPTSASIARFLSVIQQRRLNHQATLIHCKDGEGRAVFFGAIYRIEFNGLSPRQAYAAQRRLPCDLMWLRHLIPNVGLFSNQNPKKQLLLSYAPTLQAPSPSKSVLAIPLSNVVPAS